MIHGDNQSASGLRVLQLTDTHLFAAEEQALMGIATRASLLPIVEQIAQIQPSPDLLLLTGDLSQDGSPESYKQIIELLSPLNLPIYWLPGNHDCVEVMAQSLTVPPFMNDKSFVKAGWQFLLLNSQLPGEVPGYLNTATLNWLKFKLDANELPTTIAFHHPPLTLNTEWLDSSALQNSNDLFQILDRHPQVKLVLFGHIHQEVQQERSGITYLGCPSTCFQFARDHQTFTLDVDRFPGFRILDLAPDGSWRTRVHRVDCQMKPMVNSRGY
jgi:3',5'-cyclic-AMP phosphodiesterase